jgi:hypothetical protein
VSIPYSPFLLARCLILVSLLSLTIGWVPSCWLHHALAFYPADPDLPDSVVPSLLPRPGCRVPVVLLLAGRLLHLAQWHPVAVGSILLAFCCAPSTSRPGLVPGVIAVIVVSTCFL